MSPKLDLLTIVRRHDRLLCKQDALLRSVDSMDKQSLHSKPSKKLEQRQSVNKEDTYLAVMANA